MLSIYSDSSVCNVAYSHDGTQLAKGLSTGDVKVFDSMSDRHLFTLGGPATTSEASLCCISNNNIYVRLSLSCICTSEGSLTSNLTSLL